MTRAQIRYTAHKALERVEWIDRHVKARNVKDSKRLEAYLLDLSKYMLKIIDAPIRDEKPTQESQSQDASESD